MKTLVLGESPEALYFCQKLLELEVGSVTIWGDLNPKEILEKFKNLEFLDLDIGYWDSLLKNLSKNIYYRNEKIVRIQKTYIAHSKKEKRILDTFKVVYEKSHEDKTMETFENYDLVFDIQNEFQKPKWIGNDSPAVQELKASKTNKIFYGTESFLLENVEDKVAIIGSHPHVLEFTKCHDFKEVILVDSEMDSESLLKFNEEFEQKIIEFEEAKKNGSRVEEPLKKVTEFRDVVVTNVDSLEDKDELFLTLERPSFMGEEILKTIAAKQVFVFTGYRDSNERNLFLLKNDPGYYFVNSSLNLEGLEESWLNIKDDFLQFFSKA